MRPTKQFHAGVSFFLAIALCGPVAAEIEEITVTAQKREENVQDVPISVTTFSDDFFTKSSVNTLRDMARYAPNLSLPQSSTVANQRIIMRGVGSVGNSAIEPTVAVFIDGVYYPRPSSIVGSMTDLERVEVLRGPQGTLFGRNASMGALNIVTKNPTNEHEGRIAFGYGDYDEKRVSGHINSALSETAAARLSFQASQRDGYGENTYTDQGSRGRVGDWDDLSVRGKLLLTPGATTDILLTADYSRVRNEGAVTEFVGGTAPTGALRRVAGILPTGQLPEAGDVYDHKIHQMHRDDADDDQWGLNGDVTWEMRGHTVRSITSYRDWQNDSLDQSVIRLPADLVPTDQLYDAETFSQELQISSPQGGKMEYVLGLYYYDEEYSLDQDLGLGEDFCAAVENLYRGQLLADLRVPNPSAPGGVSVVKLAGARDAFFSGRYLNSVRTAVTSGISNAISTLPAAQQQAIIAGVTAAAMRAGTQVARNNNIISGSNVLALRLPDSKTLTKAKEEFDMKMDELLPPVLRTPIKNAISSNVINNSAVFNYKLQYTLSFSPLPTDPSLLATQVQNFTTVANGAALQAKQTCLTGGTEMAVSDFTQDVKNYAAYGHLTYHLGPQWRVSTGARFTRSEKEGRFSNVVHNPLAAPRSVTNPFGLDLRQNESNPDLEHDEDKVTWMANLSHFLDDDTMLFANYSTGFKSGGFNPEGFNSRIAAAERTRKFDTETTRNYELGVKRTLMGGSLVANATLYRTEVDDFQERQFDGLNLIVHNSGDLTQQGIELDILFEPREEFFASLGVSYLDSEFDTFPNATALPGRVAMYSLHKDLEAACKTGVAIGTKLGSECRTPTLPTRNLKGERNHFSPKWQAAVSAEWTDSLADLAADWFVRGEYQFVDDQNVGADTNQDPDTMQGNYNLFNGGAGVRSQNGDWEVQIFVKNIFDEEYCQTKYSQPLVGSLGLADTTGMEGYRGAKRCSLGEPRTWSLTGSFLF